MTPSRFDAVVVGAGHNGLIAACYLAGAGLRVVVLERREIIGGATVTEEIIPGFRVSSASYSLSLLRPDVHRDLRLGHHGLHLSPKDPQLFVPLLDRRHFFVWRDAARTRDEIARIHPGDADGYSAFAAFWDEAAALLRPFVESDDPPPAAEVERSLARRGRADVWRLAVAGSVAECVEHFFASDEVRGAFASQGIIGTFLGPRDPGTAWVMAYHFLGGELLGATGTWGYVRGGMGSVAAAIAAEALERGVNIRTGSAVSEVLIDEHGVRGVRLREGGVIEAPLVLSGADPVRTFLGLVPGEALPAEFVERVRGWRVPGSVVKVNLAMSELPDFLARPGTEPGPQHFGTVEISPSIDYLQAAYEEAAVGRVPDRPFMEVFIQSATDATLAPPGRHVLSAFTQYAPAVDDAGWDACRDEAAAAVLRTLETYAPNVPDAVLASEVLGPPDLERRFGLTGGNIFHGEITPDQCFGGRFPYRTPVRGLYLCGSGASPGGAVMGAAGRNAARVALRDRTPARG